MEAKDAEKLITLEEFEEKLNEIVFKKTSVKKDYEPEEKLGTGSFATVHKVRRLSDGKLAAMKTLSQPRGIEPDIFRKSILSEIVLMNIVQEDEGTLNCYDCYEKLSYGRLIFNIVIELMDYPVCKLIETWPDRVDENVCKYIVFKSLRGLHSLHRKKIIHRDIKCDNVLASKNGSIKLCDFGRSVQLNQKIQQTGTIEDLYTYSMAPEMIQGSLYDEKVDVWAFGCFAHEVATGKQPYFENRADRHEKIIAKILNSETPSLGNTFSPEFDTFISHCLDKNPQSRWDTEKLLTHPFLVGAE
jgi:serine/threonine protein kinase